MNLTYESVDVVDFFVADGAHTGKTVFVAIDTYSEDENGFARLDNFELSVGPLSTDPLLRLENGDFQFGDLLHPTGNSSNSKTITFRNVGLSNDLTIDSIFLSGESSVIFSITGAPDSGPIVPPNGVFDLEVTATGGSGFVNYVGEVTITTIPADQSITLPISANISSGNESFTTGSILLVDYVDGIANGVHEQSIRNGGFEEGSASQTFAQTPTWQTAFSPEGDNIIATLADSPASGFLHGQASGYISETGGDARVHPTQDIPQLNGPSLPETPSTLNSR